MATGSTSAPTDPDVSVVIPTYNEVENLPLIVDALGRVLEGRNYELVIVDDDSPDGTWRLGESIAEQDARLRLIRRIDESGLSSAIIRGIRDARGQIVVVIDADLQHDESIMPEMIDRVAAGADICVGSRRAEGGGYGDWALGRRFASWAATLVAQRATGVDVSDPMSGYFALDRDFFSAVESKLNPRGFKVLLELLARGGNPRVDEVGYVFRERTQGETKLSGGVVYEYLLGILDLRLGRVISSQSVSYLLVTVVGMGVNLFGYLVCRLFDVNRTIAGMVGFELALLATYAGNNSFTFRAYSYRGSRWIAGLAFYHLVSIYTGLVQFSVFATLRGLPPFVWTPFGGTFSANAVAILTASIAAFMLHREYTWKRLTASAA